MSPKGNHVEIEGRRLRLSNLDKVLYPEAGFTKAQPSASMSTMPAVPQNVTLREPKAPGGSAETSSVRGMLISHHLRRAPRRAEATYDA